MYAERGAETTVGAAAAGCCGASEADLKNVVKYINDEVVPEVRRNGRRLCGLRRLSCIGWRSGWTTCAQKCHESSAAEGCAEAVRRSGSSLAAALSAFALSGRVPSGDDASVSTAATAGVNSGANQSGRGAQGARPARIDRLRRRFPPLLQRRMGWKTGIDGGWAGELVRASVCRAQGRGRHGVRPECDDCGASDAADGDDGAGDEPENESIGGGEDHGPRAVCSRADYRSVAGGGEGYGGLSRWSGEGEGGGVCGAGSGECGSGRTVVRADWGVCAGIGCGEAEGRSDAAVYDGEGD